MRNPPGEGGDDRSSQASRLFTEQAGVANLEVAGHRPLLANALERLPGRRRPQIIQVAKATLERNLRGVLSRLTPEQVKAAFGVDLAKVVGRLGAPEEKG